MLSMNGIIVLELILGVLLMGLIFTSLGDTDLVADSSSKAQEPESDGASSGSSGKENKPRAHSRARGSASSLV
jgi:hypothetical protein